MTAACSLREILEMINQQTVRTETRTKTFSPELLSAGKQLADKLYLLKTSLHAKHDLRQKQRENCFIQAVQQKATRHKGCVKIV